MGDPFARTHFKSSQDPEYKGQERKDVIGHLLRLYNSFIAER